MINSDFYKTYRYILSTIIKSNGIEKLSCKEKKKLLKLLNETPLVNATPVPLGPVPLEPMPLGIILPK